MAEETEYLRQGRAELAAAEQALLTARERVRTLAVQNGLPTEGLFAGSLFIWRATAESWREDARREAEVSERKTLAAVIELVMKSSGSATIVGARSSLKTALALLGISLQFDDAVPPPRDVPLKLITSKQS